MGHVAAHGAAGCIYIIIFIAVTQRAYYAYTLVDKHVQQNGQVYKASLKVIAELI